MNLVLDQMSQQNGAAIALANANTYGGSTYVNGVITNLLNTTGSGNAIPGNLIITGGNNNGTDSLAPPCDSASASTTTCPWPSTARWPLPLRPPGSISSGSATISSCGVRPGHPDGCGGSHQPHQDRDLHP